MCVFKTNNIVSRKSLKMPSLWTSVVVVVVFFSLSFLSYYTRTNFAFLYIPLFLSTIQWHEVKNVIPVNFVLFLSLFFPITLRLIWRFYKPLFLAAVTSTQWTTQPVDPYWFLWLFVASTLLANLGKVQLHNHATFWPFQHNKHAENLTNENLVSIRTPDKAK